MKRRVLTLAVVLIAVGACSDSKPSGSTTTTTTGSTATTSTSSTTTSSSSGDTMAVQVFFLDQDAFNIGRPPYTRPVDRTVNRVTPADGALRALFAGPTPDEAAGGLLFVASGATGFADLRIADRTAHVRLTGGCSSGGSTFTVAEEIAMTLRQFTSIDSVKIYDPNGATEQPNEPGDSIPECLEP